MSNNSHLVTNPPQYVSLRIWNYKNEYESCKNLLREEHWSEKLPNSLHCGQSFKEFDEGRALEHKNVQQWLVL
ncbi:hypothetical protein CDL12_08905 [Handroanthus impetiginosus]|uniref:Uncharacterized protein n=1 Tax=Handroanthus impetiginosus TaxID=429701 RepID=A0A2G9HLN3_9LAMI|nr:hypothetical protein CDL12_08905 [Handroanthus impetiginosus]